MDSISKIFASIILKRISGWVETENILNECQAGFRKGYSTYDNIFSLNSIIELKLMDGKKVYCFFVDFKAAFDTINRNALFYKLHNCGLSTKIISLLKNWYQLTQTAVWNGTSLSEWFTTQMGLKQGCILSPILFSLFLNDLDECLGGGVTMGETVIRLLMYADVLVLIADQPEQLQSMIKNLEKYCLLWSLIVNLEKSKIMIFRRKGGRIPQNEKWYFNNIEIQIVNEYKYLGIIKTPSLSMKKHLAERLSTGKLGLNTIWKNFMAKTGIKHSDKYKVFQAVQRSVVCYGAQVWGYKRHEEVERILRFFFKRLFRLPDSTPNYMIAIESGLDSMFIFTLKLHLHYMLKVLQYPDSRLPKILALKCIAKKVSWFKEWLSLFQINGLGNIDMENVAALGLNLDILVEKERLREREGHIARARIGQRHDLYSQLSYNDISYFHDDNSLSYIALIFKARGGLLYLNDSILYGNRNPTCSLCNTGNQENTVHFFALCPVLSEFRVRHFGSAYMTETQLLTILNKSGNIQLFNFAQEAIPYRKYLISQYNS